VTDQSPHKIPEPIDAFQPRKIVQDQTIVMRMHCRSALAFTEALVSSDAAERWQSLPLSTTAMGQTQQSS
jgi:hypothetical protein